MIFIGDVCRCDHWNQNLMVSNNIIKAFYRPYNIEARPVCLIACG